MLNMFSGASSPLRSHAMFTLPLYQKPIALSRSLSQSQPAFVFLFTWMSWDSSFIPTSYLAVILPFLLIVIIIIIVICLFYGIVIDSIAKAGSLSNHHTCMNCSLEEFIIIIQAVLSMPYGSMTTVSYLSNSLDTNMKSTWIDTVWRWDSVSISLSISYSFDRCTSLCLTI